MGHLNLEKFRERFLDILENHGVSESLLEQDEVETTLAGDEIDRASVERERALQLKLQGRDLFYLKKIREALNRIDLGTYGECIECGQQIEPGRL